MALIPAVKRLRKSFDDAHSEWGTNTQNFCYALLHGGSLHEPANAYSDYLTHINTKLGTPATQRFEYMLAQGTPPAILTGFYELYIGGTSIQALIIFKELIAIGRANEERLTIPYLDWAVAQTSHVIRHHTDRIELWIKDVCDKRVYDPSEELEERLFWRKWQAPMLLMMQPFWRMPYHPSKDWERMDAEASAATIELIAGAYALKLQSLLDNAAGDVAVELAKQPIPKVRDSTADNTQQGTLPATPALKPRSNSKPKKPSGPELKKRSVIFGALQGNLEGLAYCRALGTARINNLLRLDGRWLSQLVRRSLHGQKWELAKENPGREIQIQEEVQTSLPSRTRKDNPASGRSPHSSLTSKNENHKRIVNSGNCAQFTRRYDSDD